MEDLLSKHNSTVFGSTTLLAQQHFHCGCQKKSILTIGLVPDQSGGEGGHHPGAASCLYYPTLLTIRRPCPWPEWWRGWPSSWSSQLSPLSNTAYHGPCPWQEWGRGWPSSWNSQLSPLSNTAYHRPCPWQEWGRGWPSSWSSQLYQLSNSCTM